MQADAVASEAFCRLASCKPQACATLACRISFIVLVDLYHQPSSVSKAYLICTKLSGLDVPTSIYLSTIDSPCMSLGYSPEAMRLAWAESAALLWDAACSTCSAASKGIGCGCLQSGAALVVC